MSVSDEPIKLFVNNETAYIWTSEDWIMARKNRIVGNFVGRLAPLPRQDAHDGLPLALLPEEATLLLEKRLAEMKYAPSLSEMPGNEARERYRMHRESVLTEQVGLLKDQRKREIQSNIKRIVEGKMKKIRKKTTEPSSDNSRSRDELFVDMETFEKEVLQEEMNRIQDPRPSALSVQIFTGDPWLESNEVVDYNWKYPQTQRDRLHYLTYKDLWEQGFYVTSGRKFGADYLAYPGDPVKFHSLFIIRCVDREQDIKISEIVTHGRLGQSVRKTFAFAYLDEDGTTVKYQSIQWEGH